MYMPIRGTKIVLIGQEMYELSAPENEGVLLQHKVCISVACEMCCPIWDSIALVKTIENNNVTYTRNCLVVIIHIFHSYD